VHLSTIKIELFSTCNLPAKKSSLNIPSNQTYKYMFNLKQCGYSYDSIPENISYFSQGLSKGTI